LQDLTLALSGIIPCGMRDAPVTSMHQLGIKATRQEVEKRLIHHAKQTF